MTLSLVPELAGFERRMGNVARGASSACCTRRVESKAGSEAFGAIHFRRESDRGGNAAATVGLF
jgi:hypothetical protein